MIIIDFTGIAMASHFSQGGKADRSMLRHLILNNIRMYNHKFRDKFGEMVIACDGGSWRKDVFKEYKASRKKNRDKDDGTDWNAVFSDFNAILDEIEANIPWKVIRIQKAEADDIIGVLTLKTQEFGQSEPVMIISSDHDFIQLHRFANVTQFSPIKGKRITDKNPNLYLKEHILRGDNGDGIPNVLSDDDTFVSDEKRQNPLSKKKVEEWVKDINLMPENVLRNYHRNQRCIDLTFIPDELVKEILDKYESQKVAPNGKILNYLIQNRCNNLIPSVGEFFSK